MTKHLILLLATFLLGSCGNDQTKVKEKSEFDTLFAEVMTIHDDVMPETNNLYKLKKFAQENLQVIPDTSAYVKKLLDVQVLSDKADDAMMDWMAQFKIPESDHNSKIKYLENEKKSISEVRDLMLLTIYEGKKLIAETDTFISKNKLRDDIKTTWNSNN